MYGERSALGHVIFTLIDLPNIKTAGQHTLCFNVIYHNISSKDGNCRSN